ncbi:40S ribosomal protein S27 [Ilyonectria robusta]
MADGRRKGDGHACEFDENSTTVLGGVGNTKAMDTGIDNCCEEIFGAILGQLRHRLRHFANSMSHRFSPLISSTPPRPPRPRSTSSRYDKTSTRFRHPTTHLTMMTSRLSSLPPDPSSWTSSAPAASPSPPSSPTPRPSSSARVAPPCCASPPVARPV